MDSIGTDQILATPFEMVFVRNEEQIRVKFRPCTMSDVLAWASERKTAALSACKQMGITDLNVMLNITSGSVVDAYHTMVETPEGRVFLINNSAKSCDEKYANIAASLRYDEARNTFREIAGRGGLIAPKTKEEADEWQVEWIPPPPIQSASGDSAGALKK